MKLSKEDLHILNSYRFLGDELSKSRENRKKNEKLLCIRENKLDWIERQNVTCWELFKSLFGRGKLAGCDLRLTSIGKYLEKREFTALSHTDIAYQTIHAIAARLLAYQKTPSLWEKLATKKQAFDLITFETVVCKRTREELQAVDTFTLAITPLSTVGHVLVQMKLAVNKVIWPFRAELFAHRKFSVSKTEEGVSYKPQWNEGYLKERAISPNTALDEETRNSLAFNHWSGRTFHRLICNC